MKSVHTGGVSIKNLSKQVKSTVILDDVSIEFPAGKMTVLIGPSGCGKTTLLRTIAGLEEASSGTVTIGDRDVTHVDPAKRGVGMVFQSYALYPHLDVRGNWSFGLESEKLSKKEKEARIIETARMLGITDLLHRKPRELSGGQRQRVAMGRTIAKEPQVFLFDEPLSNLDTSLRGQTRVELARLKKKVSSTMIYVTHDQVEAMTLADQMVVLNRGRVEQVGTPLEVYQNPINQFVAGFLGSPSMNFVAGFALGLRPDCVAGVRPESLDLEPKAGSLRFPFEVELIENLGDHVLIYGQIAGVRGSPWVIKKPGRSTVTPGQVIQTGISQTDILLFDRETGLRVAGTNERPGLHIEKASHVEMSRETTSSVPTRR